MTHDIFPFVNVFVVTNILTRNYHEFLHFLILSQYIIQSMSHKNHIFELLKILQCKTGNEFRKSHLFKPLSKFLTFP